MAAAGALGVGDEGITMGDPKNPEADRNINAGRLGEAAIVTALLRVDAAESFNVSMGGAGAASSSSMAPATAAAAAASVDATADATAAADP